MKTNAMWEKILKGHYRKGNWSVLNNTPGSWSIFYNGEYCEGAGTFRQAKIRVTIMEKRELDRLVDELTPR